MFTGKTWDGVSTKGREPVFRVQVLIEEALFGGKENRAFLVKFACYGREPLGDREAFNLCGKREGRGTAWRLSRPMDSHQDREPELFQGGRGGRRKVVAARGSKQCPPRGVRRVHSGSGVGRWVREVDNVHMRSMKREGVKGKAENNTRVTRQRAVPFEVFSLHRPLIT